MHLLCLLTRQTLCAPRVPTVGVVHPPWLQHQGPSLPQRGDGARGVHLPRAAERAPATQGREFAPRVKPNSPLTLHPSMFTGFFFFFPFSPPFAFAFQSSGSREYLTSLERVAAWVAERVLPFLAQSGHDGEAMEEETTALAAHITKVRFCR